MAWVSNLEQLSGSLGIELTRLVPFFESAASPDLAVRNFDRWLAATGNPRLFAEQSLLAGDRASGLIAVFGASQSLSDSVIQNPEFGAIVLDATRNTSFTVESLREECQSLVKQAISYSHALDRLRFVKQKSTLLLAVDDLLGRRSQPEIWLGLSELAEAIVAETAEVAWQHHARMRGLTAENPVSVIAFGKFGGHEINYSSDVDLAFVLRDDVDELLEREAIRYCEALTRALSDRMGRGALYRVDLRLRPYGSQGELIRRMRSYEGYYERYAERWEWVALIRSRIVYDGAEVADRWEAVRCQFGFPGRTSEASLDELFRIRDHLDDFANESDFKRGPGGIRDIEFLVQLHQHLYAHGDASLRIAPCTDAITALAKAGQISAELAKQLRADYVWLRKLEHRCQIGSDRQTHAVPTDDQELLRVSRMMGLSNAEQLAQRLEELRARTRQVYSGWRQSASKQIQAVSNELPAHIRAVFGDLHEFLGVIQENRDSLKRINQVARLAPEIAGEMKHSVPLIEALISGEIEESLVIGPGIARSVEKNDWHQLAQRLRYKKCAIWSQFVLGSLENPWQLQAQLLESVLQSLLAGSFVEAFALGSFALRDSVPMSDYDVVFFVETGMNLEVATRQVNFALDVVQKLQPLGVRFEIDLRLRPDGKKGQLVRTRSGFEDYARTEMELWERFALGHARQIFGTGMASVIRSVTELPCHEPEIEELIAMKRRIENERLDARYRWRDVKLGFGGLSDIEWMVRLTEMRYADTVGKLRIQHNWYGLEERLNVLKASGALNVVDAEAAQEHFRLLRSLRARMQLLGIKDDVLPENPDRLELLAEGAGFEDANALLDAHDVGRQTMRGIYESVLAGLI